MSKKYDIYTEDLNSWQLLPNVAKVLTSHTFGAWLMRRDENRDKQKMAAAEHDLNMKLVEELENLDNKMVEEWRTNTNIDNVTHCKYRSIVFARIKELKGE